MILYDYGFWTEIDTGGNFILQVGWWTPEQVHTKYSNAITIYYYQHNQPVRGILRHDNTNQWIPVHWDITGYRINQ